jgi:hypothetical protein
MYGLMTKPVSSIDHDSAFCAAEDASPCVMHSGNRINEKIVMMVLIEAWESCELEPISFTGWCGRRVIDHLAAIS